MRPTYWLPAVLWMAVITWLSSDVGSAAHTGNWLLPILEAFAPWATPAQLDALHGLVRKGGHLTEYALLAALWHRAFAQGRHVGPRAAAWIAFAISLGWAVLDEARQSFVPSRTASAVDVAIDGAGAFLAVVVASLGWGKAVDRATMLLLWTGLVGGTALLVVNALTGVPSGALWLTPPTAALALLARSLYARHRPRRP
ncbi:MAG TPA: VanZ family protein [Candidatus Binatia bacterium]|nr:VanZ family protein [Candidatus Binatia bacterium]